MISSRQYLAGRFAPARQGMVRSHAAAASQILSLLSTGGNTLLLFCAGTPWLVQYARLTSMPLLLLTAVDGGLLQEQLRVGFSRSILLPKLILLSICTILICSPAERASEWERALLILYIVLQGTITSVTTELISGSSFYWEPLSKLPPAILSFGLGLSALWFRRSLVPVAVIGGQTLGYFVILLMWIILRSREQIAVAPGRDPDRRPLGYVIGVSLVRSLPLNMVSNGAFALAALSGAATGQLAYIKFLSVGALITYAVCPANPQHYARFEVEQRRRINRVLLTFACIWAIIGGVLLASAGLRNITWTPVAICVGGAIGVVLTYGLLQMGSSAVSLRMVLHIVVVSVAGGGLLVSITASIGALPGASVASMALLAIAATATPRRKPWLTPYP